MIHHNNVNYNAFMFSLANTKLTPPGSAPPAVVTEGLHLHNLNCLPLDVQAIFLEISLTAHLHLTLTVIGHSLLTCPKLPHLQHLRESLTSPCWKSLLTASKIHLANTSLPESERNSPSTKNGPCPWVGALNKGSPRKRIIWFETI